MKKYLMTGIAAVAMCAAFTSCSKSDDLYDPNLDLQVVKYQQAFAEVFPVTINPNNDWGFGTSTRGVQTRSELTRSVTFPNANEWDNDYIVPNDPEKNNYEIKLVSDYFKDNKFSDATECVDFSDFFVYSISCTENGSGHMDNFHFGSSAEDAKDQNQHLNNLNAGMISDNGHHGRSMLVIGSSSKYWTYESSEGTRHTFAHFYGVDGATIDSRLTGYYYIGFDYESQGGSSNQVHAPDGYYNDVIIRISMAEGKHDNWSGRIFCEDLGGIGDFDFNDVVFDYDFAWDKTWIRLQAAGGTLPLYVGDVEVHGKFGVKTNVMVNTGAGPTRNAVVFSIPGNYNYLPGNIPITVGGTTAQLNDNSTSEPVRLIVANKGEAPQKLCVQNALPDWSPEYIPIGTTYGSFLQYIQDPTVEWWK